MMDHGECKSHHRDFVPFQRLYAPDWVQLYEAHQRTKEYPVLIAHPSRVDICAVLKGICENHDIVPHREFIYDVEDSLEAIYYQNETHDKFKTFMEASIRYYIEIEKDLKNEDFTSFTEEAFGLLEHFPLCDMRKRKTTGSLNMLAENIA